ncbi:response regulator transcription factor [Halorhabdus sp. CUG00001]|uniref:response regulator transcription factor n=1 Tax=Halorhabdus sp. CUG00001 TaxID=2600297 RepID=UPI00131C962C|nr:response regulator [Halorhabdus sp. CUG00001]
MGTQETVLVVEDDSDVRTLHRLWLAEEYHVRTAADGESAVAAVDDDVAVVLLDRNLPGLSGDAVTARLRGGEYDGVIGMVTANAPDQTLPDLGIDEYLQKPVSGAELRALVERSLSRLAMPRSVRALFRLVSLRASLTETPERTGAETNEAIRSLDDRIETAYREAIDAGVSPKRLSELAHDGLAEGVTLPEITRKQRSRPASAIGSTGHEF